MATYEINAELNLKPIIDETREVIQALSEFADNLERIDGKYAELCARDWQTRSRKCDGQMNLFESEDEE